MAWLTDNTHHAGTANHTPSPAAAPIGALRAVVAAAERLGVARNELLAAIALEARSLSNLDRAALARLEAHAGDVPEQPNPRETYVNRVRVALTKLAEEGRCSVENVAKELAVSSRTLQRRLEKAGTTFGALSDDTRRAAALAHLRNPRVPIKEAAFRLGFSEPSTFYRAFRRWTGDTPANYRASAHRHRFKEHDDEPQYA